MALISPILEDYRKKHRIKQVGSFDGNKSKIVSLPFNVNTPIDGYNYYFPADNTLDGTNCVISEIAVVSSTAQTKVATSDGAYSVDNLSTLNLVSISLYICDINQQVISVIPLTSLCAELNGGKPAYTWFDTQVWANSYVLFNNGIAIPSNVGIVLRVSYFDKYINA